jgi:hypothetical protein
MQRGQNKFGCNDTAEISRDAQRRRNDDLRIWLRTFLKRRQQRRQAIEPASSNPPQAHIPHEVTP